jgi:hypothetical protein
MARHNEENPQKPEKPAASIDEWAVALALALALLVWVGAIKHVAW